MTSSSPVHKLTLRVLLLLIACASGSAQHAIAQQAEDVEEPAKEEVVEEEKVRPTIDLGRFELRDSRPAANETAKVTFALHLALAVDTDEKIVQQLEKWQHRLRDQVIIAMRKTETKDFLEPNLNMLRRNILIRVNRLLKMSLVEETLLSEFAFTTH